MDFQLSGKKKIKEFMNILVMMFKVEDNVMMILKNDVLYFAIKSQTKNFDNYFIIEDAYFDTYHYSEKKLKTIQNLIKEDKTYANSDEEDHILVYYINKNVMYPINTNTDLGKNLSDLSLNSTHSLLYRNFKGKRACAVLDTC